MLIHDLPGGDQVHHYKKCIVVTFSGKRHVISTGPNRGGYREDLLAVFNQDANPGPGMACVMKDKTYEGHMNAVAREDLGLPPDRCSGLCTAASMEHAAILTESFRDLTVTAIVTAGVEHNGGRAGDPASFYEEDGDFFSLSGTSPGTINIILHINACLDSGCLARTIMTATEAKTAALQELLARSHHSRGLATGSATDGIICICDPSSPLLLTNAGKNSKLGELIGKTVKAAVKKALYLQSGLCPDRQRDILRIMGRFGIDEDHLWEARPDSCHGAFDKAIFMDRLDHLKKKEDVVNISFLYAHLLDLLSWGMIDRKQAAAMARRLLIEIDSSFLPGPGEDSASGITDTKDEQRELINLYISFINRLSSQDFQTSWLEGPSSRKNHNVN